MTLKIHDLPARGKRPTHVFRINYYGITEYRAQEIARRITVLHPYGAIGSLPWHDVGPVFPFGHEDGDLLSMSYQVKTFTERLDDEDVVCAIHNEVQDAYTLVFLGFAFHPQNMKLITPALPSNVRRVFATAKGISDADCIPVVAEIHEMLKHSDAHIAVRNDLGCAGLFNEYWRTLARAP